MKREAKNNKYVQCFDSINEFYQYISKTPFNETFQWSAHRSVECGIAFESFSKTRSFEQAVELLKNGWDDMAKQLQNKIASKDVNVQMVQIQKSVLSVQGFQPVVPLYLAGVPQNMVSKQMQPVKQKVVNITKSINYSAFVSSDKIVEESIKVMQLVRKLERQGIKCNISVALGVEAGGRTLVCKIKVKNASERLNVSKLAFPLVHPSMLRRLLLRYIEVCPDTIGAFRDGYGHPIDLNTMRQLFDKEFVIPAKWDVDIDQISTLEQITGKI